MYETKVILAMMAEKAADAKNTKEIYNFVRNAANVEGMDLPSFEEFKRKREEEK